MGAVAGSRDLDQAINAESIAFLPLSDDIDPPAVAIEIRREKDTGVVRPDRVS